MEQRIIKVGLAGNPNTGKTTLFNAITGANQKVGNYPGVTVEKKEGRRVYDGIEFHIFDLPGTYSLTAYSADEVVTRDFIIDEKPDIIVDVLDATNIERNLYLCLQLQELDIPVVGALNVTDQAGSMGIKIDEKVLSELLGIPMVRTVGTRGKGVEALLDAVIKVFERSEMAEKKINYGYELEAEISKLETVIREDEIFSREYPPRWIALKLLEKDKNVNEKLKRHSNADKVRKRTGDCIKAIESHFGRDCEIVVTEQRYAYVHGAVTEAVKRVEIPGSMISETVDKVLLNRILGLPIFLLVIWAIFQATFKIGEYPMAWLEWSFGWISSGASAVLPEGFLRSLIVDGIIGGVGGVMSFVPLIIILFALLSFLEDTGYMSRAAFVMDKFLHMFGLHGQSFMPMMLGFGCSVPAIMAARTLKNPRDRIKTVLIIPFMSCSAKLPVYVLLAAAFFPQNAGNAVMSVYLIGVMMGLFSSVVLSRTVLRGRETPFVMELPPYRMPTFRGILMHVWEKTWMYVKKAGTVILGAAILIWTITTFPVLDTDISKYRMLPAHEAELAKARDSIEFSIAGRLGKVIEPVVAPIGFDWKIGISAVTGFAAKEVVVSTLGVLYKVGLEEGEESESLREAIRRDKAFSPLVGYVLMLFVLIVAPCFAAQSMMGAEIGWRWVAFHFAYTAVLAWSVCFMVYQGGKMLGLGV